MRLVPSASVAVLSAAVLTAVVACDSSSGVATTDTTIVSVVEEDEPAATDSPPATASTVEPTSETGVLETVTTVVDDDETLATVIDDDLLESALLTAEDLNNAEELEYLGDRWEVEDDRPQITVRSDDQRNGRVCPDGDRFFMPASIVELHLNQEADSDAPYHVRVRESIMSFEQTSSADSLVNAYESCVNQQWTKEGNPDEFLTVERVDIAGDESTGFVVLYALEDGGETAHDEGLAFVRLSPTVIVALDLTMGSAEPTVPYDASILDDLTAVAVAKADALISG